MPRIKDIDYDDDDLDYDDEDVAAQEELSVEDQEQMKQGLASVRQQLGTDLEISNREIEEALWYYYYDVDKSVAYLKKQHTPAQPKPKKEQAPSRFEQAAQAAQKKKVEAHSAIHTDETTRLEEAPFSQRTRKAAHPDFFADMPWGNVPIDRISSFTKISTLPRGGLLGGSGNAGGGKPSKLSVLAAQRKKAQEEKKKSQADPSNAEGPRTSQETSSAALLDRLTISSKTGAHSEHPSEPSRDATDHTLRNEARRYKRQKIEEPEIEDASVGGTHAPPQALEKSEPEEQPAPPQDLRAAPSSFASALRSRDSIHASSTSSTHSAAMAPLQFVYTGQVSAKTDKFPLSGPSPDDVVLQAQSKGAKSKQDNTTQPATKLEADSSTNGALMKGISDIKLDDAQNKSSKSKLVDVAAEFEKSAAKNSANFVVIGHVDHGKSTLMGRLLLDTSSASFTQRQYQALQKSSRELNKPSFALAWAMDSTAEERARGITVDIATSTFSTDTTNFTILDAPGHQDFVPNMIAGTSQADFAILVVDASENAFESGLRGQTREHALLGRSMGISRIVVAVNKMDTVEWREERFDAVRTQLGAFLAATGFQEKNITFVPCAGLTGENVVHAPGTPSPSEPETSTTSVPWYTGPTLLGALSAQTSTPRRLSAPLRLTIADVFRPTAPALLSSTSVSLTGRIDTGTIQPGQSLLCLPSGTLGTLKHLESADGDSRPWAVAGEIATLHIAGMDPAYMRPGDVICVPAEPATAPPTGEGSLRNVVAFTASILAFEALLPGVVELHRGRMHVPAHITDLLALVTKASSAEGAQQPPKRKKPRVVHPGQVARLRLSLDAVDGGRGEQSGARKGVPLEVGDRVVLRLEGQTVGAGLVEVVE